MKIKGIESINFPEFLINEITHEVALMRDFAECRRIYGLTLIASALGKGALAEVGVFEGGSAWIICEAKGQTPLHLFDTFGGLPPSSPEDGVMKDKHTYYASMDKVQESLKNYANVYFHKGRFPDFSGEVPEGTRFSFVHIDVDLYWSTKDCIEYFYPRMMDGGTMLIDSYPTSQGVKKAVEDFFTDKHEYINQIGYREALIIRKRRYGHRDS